MAKKKSPDQLAKRVTITIRPEHQRAVEYLALTYNGGFSKWVQDMLSSMVIDPSMLHQQRAKKYADYEDKLAAQLHAVLGPDTEIDYSTDPAHDLLTSSGTFIDVSMQDGEPELVLRNEAIHGRAKQALAKLRLSQQEQGK